jgi:hypothetical protein
LSTPRREMHRRACGPLPPAFPLGFLVGFLNSSGNPDCFRSLRGFQNFFDPGLPMDFRKKVLQLHCSSCKPTSRCRFLKWKHGKLR